MNIEAYEKQFKQLEQLNENYLEIFKTELINAGLKEKTIKNHLLNVSLYINDFLLNQLLKMEYGCGSMIEQFIELFFIPKCLWSSPQAVKSTAASLKRFYKYMSDHGYVSKENYNELCVSIKENMEFWQEESKVYNDF